MQDEHIHKLVGHLFRHEAGKMASVLTRLLGLNSLELADDLVQDTLMLALSTWKIKGIPENPQAWLYTVAKRKALDAIRKHKIHEQHHSALSLALKSEWTIGSTVNQLFLDNEIEDSQLRMIFACCHPSIPYESQIALTLRTLCGLNISEIANSFLTNTETITKRLYRAREKIREENITLEAPIPAHLPGRLDAVLHSLYLLFNEGYNSSHPDELIRHDLCSEAMRLCLLLVNNSITSRPATKALMALMCFQASRAEARTNGNGEIILLQDQDRSQWNRDLLDRGKCYLEQSVGDDLSEYHVEAAIAGCHARAKSFDDTDWFLIVRLYDILVRIKPSPVIELNRAIAAGYAYGPEIGLEEIQKIDGLKNHYLFYAAIGDFYAASKKYDDAIANYHRAMLMTTSNAEKKLLESKIQRMRTFANL